MMNGLRTAAWLLLCAIFIAGVSGDGGAAGQMLGNGASGSLASGINPGAALDVPEPAVSGPAVSGSAVRGSAVESQGPDLAALAAWGLAEGAVLALAGDSIASGEGGRSYLAGTDLRNDRCHRSAKGMGQGMFGRGNVLNMACSRAKIADFHQAQPPSDWTEHPPAAQLESLRAAAPDVALVIVGANDIGFPHLLDQCVVEVADCSLDSALATGTQARIADLGPSLVELYRDVRKAVEGQVWIPAYPDLLNGREDCGRITESERIFGSSVVAALNSQIEQAVEQVNEGLPQAARLSYIGGTATALNGHGICSPDAWVNSAGTTGLLEAVGNQSRAQELLHPTAVGYSALTRALADHRR